MREIKLQDLKAKAPMELLAFAEEHEVENASTMRKQELMFAILKQLASRDIEIIGEGNGTTTVNFAIASLGGVQNDTLKWDGTNSETFTAYLDRLAKLPGSLQGITVTSVGALTF